MQTLSYIFSTTCATMLPNMTIMDKTSETVSEPQLNALFYKSFCSQGVSSQQQNTNQDSYLMFPKLSRNPTPFTNAAGVLLCFKGRAAETGLKCFCYVFLPLWLSSSFPLFPLSFFAMPHFLFQPGTHHPPDHGLLNVKGYQ